MEKLRCGYLEPLNKVALTYIIVFGGGAIAVVLAFLAYVMAVGDDAVPTVAYIITFALCVSFCSVLLYMALFAKSVLCEVQRDKNGIRIELLKSNFLYGKVPKVQSFRFEEIDNVKASRQKSELLYVVRIGSRSMTFKQSPSYFSFNTKDIPFFESMITDFHDVKRK